MRVLGIDHFTLQVPPDDLPDLLAFYTEALPLQEGKRPDFGFPGHWLYAGGQAVVHLAGIATLGPTSASTGRLNHISLRTTGLQATRDRLASLGLAWHEASVPGAPLHQVFLTDPAGLKIELTYDVAELALAGPMHDASAA